MVTFMADSSAHVSLQAIAQKAGVSAMTVSRVLGNSPRVAAATRRHVLATARALKYKPDPHLTRMMSLVRNRKAPRLRAALAVVREDLPQDEVRGQAYQYVPFADIHRRAEQHGYHAEEFWLGRDGLTPQRLGSILHARGIEGIIISPQSAQLPCSEIDYSHFAAVTFGYAMRRPALHLCAGNMNHGIQMAGTRLRERGYRRIGVAITQWIDDRSENGYSGGWFHFQQNLPKKERVPMLLLPHNNISRSFGEFSAWMKTHRPDALITFDTHVPGWLEQLGLRIPDDIAFVVHDWTPKMPRYAGIFQRRDHLAAAAVDLVATQLLHHERGVPEVPRQILIPPVWIEGPSLRAANA
jgi:LacI family transcriptional regulator